jgi:MFS family permease
MFLLALALGAMGQAMHLSYMVVCAIVLGVGMALIYTAIGALIAEQVPATQRGLAMGMYHSSVFMGMMSGAAAMGMALKKISYPLCYALSGGMALLALVWFIILLLRNGSNR